MEKKQIELIDIGANLNHKSLKFELEQIIHRAVQNNISRIIITGTDLRSSQEAFNLAKNNALLISTCGVHPHNAKQVNPDLLQKLEKLIAENKVVAIGECGLDFNRNFSTREEQEYAFGQQLQIAKRFKKPLFLHERDAFETFVSFVKDHLGDGVVHCFTGNKQQLKTYLDLGFHIGITGWICDDRRNNELKEAVKYIPHDRLLIETDCPFLTPREAKATRNEPAFLKFVVQRLALYMSKSEEEVAKHTTENAKKLFRL